MLLLGRLRTGNWATMIAVLLLLFHAAWGQTWTNCNPLHGACPPDSALGMAIDVDFTNGAINSFAASGSPTYDHATGVHFTISGSGQAPQLTSVFYIMFGRVEITMTAAPGPGIVSSFVLQSDDLDEIDLEWLGARPDEVQSNYFGKGQTTTYDRAQTHAIPGGSQGPATVTYVIDWTSDRIIWTIAGVQVRTLRAADASGQYPQTPMQIKFGTWAGGDPASNAPGTIAWALGPTNYAAGPFSMVVRSISATDYSTGTQYRYSDQSGSWQSIVAVGGAVNGNINAARQVPLATSAPAPFNPIASAVPMGIGTATSKPGSQPTPIGTIPAGWRMTTSGKIVPIGAATAPRPLGRKTTAALFLLGCAAYLAAAV